MPRFLTNFLARWKRKRIQVRTAKVSSATPATTGTQPVAALDTNAVHFVRLYLGLAREHNLPPYAAGSGDITSDLKKSCKGSNRALQNYKKGHKYFGELKKKSDAGWLIQYSRFTRFELSCGGLRAKAIEDALPEKMPNRWWNRLDEMETLDRLELTTYAEVEKDIDDLEALYNSAGILMSESNVRLQEVFQMGKLLFGLVYLEVGDCMVYASALVSEADEFWTGDEYLRGIAKRIEDPSSDPERHAYFEKVSTAVKEGLAEIIHIDLSQVHLPKGRP